MTSPQVVQMRWSWCESLPLLVVIVVFAEVNAADHPGFHEELERAIDRGAGDLHALSFDPEEQLVGLEVIMRGENLAEERGSLRGELESLSLQEGFKSSDFFLERWH